MPFHNRIRLPFYVTQPQFPVEARRFRLANGERKTLSVVISKVYELKTDFFSEKLHQRFQAALNHDDVLIEGDRYLGGISMDGEYSIDWQSFLDYPLAPASAKVHVTPFSMTNDNCKTCTEMTQLSLVDDDIGAINENDSGAFDVFANDTICCFPVTAEITYINATYLDTLTIDALTGLASWDTKTTAPSSGGSVKIGTYRVYCSDNNYDEADIYADVTGSISVCQTPIFSDPAVTFQGASGVTVDWGGTGNFEWALYECENLGTPVLTGTVATNQKVFPDDDTLSVGQCYTFCVRKDCGSGNFSEWACTEFTIAPPENTCGKFHVVADDGTVEPNGYEFSYMDCAGIIRNSIVFNLSFRNVCMLMTMPGFVPVYFEGGPHVGYSYTEPC